MPEVGMCLISYAQKTFRAPLSALYVLLQQ